MKEIDSMIDTIKRKGVTNKKILDAMSSINRALFVSESSKNLAYSDLALPIGEAQSISQPYIVARMLDLLEIKSSDKVLEVGSGLGYVSAILSRICSKVIGLEINENLAEESRETIKKLKLSNVRILNEDGSNGFIHGYPYDKILISAATPKVTTDLLDQLNPGGILIAPIGDRMRQTLTKIVKTSKGYERQEFDKVMFVPLTGEKGF